MEKRCNLLFVYTRYFYIMNAHTHTQHATLGSKTPDDAAAADDELYCLFIIILCLLWSVCREREIEINTEQSIFWRHITCINIQRERKHINFNVY